MKALYLIAILLLAGALPAQAQYNYGSIYTCWKCPACGTVFTLTSYEAAYTNPYSLCPVCRSAYAGAFSQVQCQSPGIYGGYGTMEGSSYSEDVDVSDGNYSYDSYDSSGENNNSLQGTRKTSIRSPSAKLQGRVLMVLAPKDYQADELEIPMSYFESLGLSVDLASKGTEHPLPMDEGSGAPPRKNVEAMEVSDVHIPDYSAVIFVGGEGVYELKLYEDPDYVNLAKSAVEEDKVVGAICMAPFILANAGLLEGRKATAADSDYLEDKGAEVVDEAVVRDGLIVTASGPSAAQEFAEAVGTALAESIKPNASDAEGSLQGNVRPSPSPSGVQSGSPKDERYYEAPAYSGGSPKVGAASSAKYRCDQCAYVYDQALGNPSQGVPPGTPFEDLPSDWRCPVCGAGLDRFAKA